MASSLPSWLPLCKLPHLEVASLILDGPLCTMRLDCGLPWQAGNLVLAHEWAHNFGLAHSSFRDVEYGDCASNMGNCWDGQYHTGQKHRLGWIPEGRAVTLHPWGNEACRDCVDGGIFTVAAHDMARGGVPPPPVSTSHRVYSWVTRSYALLPL